MSLDISEKETILLVDDSQTILEIIRNVLVDSGFKASVATDWKSALKEIESVHPDLIVLDVVMPQIDGFEICRRLKADPSTKDIPVIFMATPSDTTEIVKGLKSGAVDYITKPERGEWETRKEELVTRIKIHLTLWRQQKVLQEENLQLQQQLQKTALMNAFKVQQTADIGEYASLASSDNVLTDSQPELHRAITALGTVASTVRGYETMTSPITRRNALLQANEQLETVAKQVNSSPELSKSLINDVVTRWRSVLVAEGGNLAQAKISDPVTNPYVVGNPVKDHQFIGREDIMRCLEELWIVKGQCPSVVIYGHRRMGKSSILRNLGASLGSQTTVVDFNMQRVGLVDSTGELLYNFALAIYDALPVALQDQLGDPDEKRFTSHNPYTALDRFLKQLDSIRAEQRFIIAIDEFELIEQLIEQQRLEPRLLDFWRGLIQTYPWFVLAFAGLHTLQEMTQNYWNPLFGSVTAIPVSFLSPKAAERLITQPSPDFNLDYDAEAIAEIIQLTNGQPYLVQLTGHTLVTRFNRQMFEEGIERERRFTLADVQAVINTPEFYRDGNAYFNGVWVQAEKSEPAGQTAILEALGSGGLSITAIAEKTPFRPEQIQAALGTLKGHDVVVKQDNGQYVYTVELMRRWVARRTGES